MSVDDDGEFVGSGVDAHFDEFEQFSIIECFCAMLGREGHVGDGLGTAVGWGAKAATPLASPERAAHPREGLAGDGFGEDGDEVSEDCVASHDQQN